jgi:hypothetical protein
VAAIVDVTRRPWPPSSLLQAAAAVAASLSDVTIAESHHSTAGGYAVPMPLSCSALDMARQGSAYCSFDFLVRRPVYVNSLKQIDFRFYPFRLHLHYESLSKHVGLGCFRLPLTENRLHLYLDISLPSQIWLDSLITSCSAQIS